MNLNFFRNWFWHNIFWTQILNCTWSILNPMSCNLTNTKEKVLRSIFLIRLPWQVSDAFCYLPMHHVLHISHLICQEQVLPDYVFGILDKVAWKKAKYQKTQWQMNKNISKGMFVVINWLYKMIQSKFLQLWATKIILWPNSLRKSMKSRRTFIVCLCSFSTPCCVIWLEWKSKLIPVTASASSDTGSLGVANSLNTTSPQTADIWVVELVLAVKFRVHLSIDNMLIGGIGGILFYSFTFVSVCVSVKNFGHSFFNN